MPRKKSIIDLTRYTIEEYRAAGKLPLMVMADNVRSMHNIGSIFRTSDAFLVDTVILAGISATPPQMDITKTALGAERSVAWRYAPDSLEEVRMLKGQGWKICVLEQAEQSVELDKFVPSHDSRYVIVVGNEVEGVDQRIVDLADTVIEIPQCGYKHSLNVSVSAGIAIWHFFSHLR